jgi:hypothetical protein
MLNVIMQCAVMLNAVMLTAVMLNVVMLRVVALFNLPCMSEQVSGLNEQTVD